MKKEKKYKYAILRSNRKIILTNLIHDFYPLFFDRLFVDPEITEHGNFLRLKGDERLYELSLFEGMRCTGIIKKTIDISNYILEKE